MWKLPKDKPPEEGLGLRLFLSLLLQLSDFVVINVCDKPPEEGLGLKLSLFLLWFWLSIFVVVDANLELRLLVFKQSCKA